MPTSAKVSLSQRALTSCSEASSIPATLRGGPGQPPALRLPTPTRVRTVELNEILDPATGAPTEVLLNNLGFHQHVAGGTVIPRQTSIETPKLNTVEEWDIVNTTGDAVVPFIIL